MKNDHVFVEHPFANANERERERESERNSSKWMEYSTDCYHSMSAFTGFWFETQSYNKIILIGFRETTGV